MSTLRRALLFALTAVVCGCGVSEDREATIGRQNADQVNSRVRLVQDPVLNAYVQALGTSIAKTTSRADLDWRFYIVDSHDVNAFALPGGIVYVNRGLIERADRLDEL